MATDDMTPEAQLTARVLDKLVDGELSEVERREVLAALEARPDGWRQCALTFLEHQEFSRAIPMSASLETNSKQPVLEHSAGRFRWSSVLALAATAFFAFVLGLRSDGWLRPQPRTPGMAQSEAAEPTAQLVSRPDRGPHGLTIDDFLSQPTIVPEDVLRELERAGHAVQTHRGLLPGTRSDGSPVLIPYEELEVVPVNNITH